MLFEINNSVVMITVVRNGHTVERVLVIFGCFVIIIDHFVLNFVSSFRRYFT